MMKYIVPSLFYVLAVLVAYNGLKEMKYGNLFFGFVLLVIGMLIESKIDSR